MSVASFPLFLQLQGRRVVVAGGGETAIRKLRLLLASGCAPLVVAPEPCAELEELERAGRVILARRAFRAEDLAGAALAFAACEDEAEAALVAAAARAAGVPVNAPDRPALSTFYMPALIERAPITIAISTDGASPLLARKLRERIEALLPDNLGRFARFLGGVKERLKAGPRDFDARRRFLECVVEGPLADRFLEGDEAGAEASVAVALREADWEGEARGAVTVIESPEQADLLTLRDLRRLQEADVLVYEAQVPDTVLAQVRRDARRVFAGATAVRSALSGLALDRLLLSEARAGHRVVHLTARRQAQPTRRLAS